ncbi:MAG: oligosaccharide flippase family protein [bacterium]
MSETVKPTGLLSIAILGSGNVIGTVISAIALILFSRFMGPTEFGLFSAAFAAMQIIIRLSDLGTNMAAERAIARVHGKDDRLADRLMRVALYFKLASFAVFAVIAWFLAPWISLSLLHLENFGLIRTAFLLALGSIFFEYSTIVFQSTNRFAMVARITIAQALGKLLIGLIFIWQGMLHATEGLLIYGIMPGIGALAGWKTNPLKSFSLPTSWRKDLQIILKVAKWTAVAAIAATLADNIDTLLVQSFMSSYDTGIWSGAVRIAGFASLLGWSVGSVLNVRVAKYHNIEHLNKYLQKAWKLALFIFVALLISLPLAGLAIKLTIGSAYLSGTIPLQILIVAAGLAGASSPYVALFYLFDRPEYYAIAGIIQTIILIAGDMIFIPQFGLIGAAWVRVVVRMVVLLFTLIYARSAYVKHLRS